MYKCHIGSCIPRRTLMESKKKKCTVPHIPAHICTHMHTHAHSCTLLHMSTYTSAHCYTLQHMSTYTSAHLCTLLQTSANFCTLLHTPAHVYIHFHTLLHTPAHFQHTLRYSHTLKHTPFNEGMKKVSQLHPSLPYFTVSSQSKPANTISSTPPQLDVAHEGKGEAMVGHLHSSIIPILTSYPPHCTCPCLILMSLYPPSVPTLHPPSPPPLPTLLPHPLVPPSFPIPLYPPPHAHPPFPPPSPPHLTHPHPLLIPDPTPSPIITIYSLPSLFAQKLA